MDRGWVTQENRNSITINPMRIYRSWIETTSKSMSVSWWASIKSLDRVPGQENSPQFKCKIINRSLLKSQSRARHWSSMVAQAKTSNFSLKISWLKTREDQTKKLTSPCKLPKSKFLAAELSYFWRNKSSPRSSSLRHQSQRKIRAQ